MKLVSSAKRTSKDIFETMTWYWEQMAEMDRPICQVVDNGAKKKRFEICDTGCLHESVIQTLTPQGIISRK